MTITAPTSSMTSHLEEVDVEDVKKIQPGDYLTGVWRFGKFSEWCKQCAAEMDDHDLVERYKNFMITIVIETFLAVQEHWETDLTVCAKILTNIFAENPKMERALQKILNTTDLIKEFNMDIFVRSIIISVIKNPPPSMKEKPETSSALHSPNTEDLPPKKKKKLISVTNSPAAVPQKLKIKMSPAATITPDAGMGQIVAGFVPAKNTSAIRIFQVRLLCGLDDNFVRTADPWPKNPLNPSFWDISINSFVDYMAFKYTKEDFHVGEFVYALFCLDMKKRTMSSEFYPGRVAEIAEETIKIEYEDTDVQAVKYDQLFKMSDVKDQSLVTPPKFSKPIEEF